MYVGKIPSNLLPNKITAFTRRKPREFHFTLSRENYCL